MALMKFIATYDGKALAKDDAIIQYVFDTVLENNSWGAIAMAIKMGLDQTLGWHTQKKAITSGTYAGFNLIYIDWKANRYNYSDGTGASKAVFQFEKVLYSFAGTQMNSQTPASNTSQATMNATLVSIYNSLPEDLKKVIKEVNVPTGTGGGNTTVVSPAHKLFLPSEYETFGRKTYGLGNTEGAQFYGFSTFRKWKQDPNGTYKEYWLRSPVYEGTAISNSQDFCTVTSSNYGEPSHWPATSSRSIAPCFAI